MASRYNTRHTKSYWRINENIQANQLRVIGPDGKQLGIFSVREALDKAREAELDLVEIAPQAKPPVAKIIDFTKFKYQQEKKEREQKLKERKGAEQKEIWLTPFMAENDFQVRLSRIKEFLEDGSRVRITVKFTGRQMGHKEFGYDIVNKVTGETKDIAKANGQPKFLGRQLMFTLSPYKGQATKQEGDQNEENKTENQEVGNSTN